MGVGRVHEIAVGFGTVVFWPLLPSVFLPAHYAFVRCRAK